MGSKKSIMNEDITLDKDDNKSRDRAKLKQPHIPNSVLVD